MKRRKLKKWIKNLLLLITIPLTLFLLMIDDIGDVKGIIVAYVILGAVSLNWFILFKYGGLNDEQV